MKLTENKNCINSNENTDIREYKNCNNSDRDISLPLISLIIPIYNAEKYLYECLLSVENQSYKNLEVILIDDGSTDSSKEICSQFSDRDPRFHYYYQDNKGVSEARNHGLRLAKGEYITFADSDDVLHPKMVEIQYKNIEKTKMDIAVSRYFSISNRNDISDEKSIIEDKPLKICDVDESISLLLKDSTYSGYTWNKIFRTSLIKNDNKLIIDFDTELHMCEDLYFSCQAIKNAGGACFSDDKLYYYYDNIEGITSGKYSLKLFTQIDAIEKMIKLFEGNKFVQDIFAREICLVIISQYSRMIKDKVKNSNIEREYKNTIKKYSYALNQQNINWKDKLLGNLIISLPAAIYRQIYKLYSSVK